MNKLLNIVRLSFSTVIRNIGSLIILIILMTFCVISFNRIIGYIRYQNQISSTFFKSNLDNAIAYSNLEISPISQTFVENKDLLDEKQIIENMEGVKGVGDRYLLFCELLMEESKWFEYTAPDGTTMVEKYHRELIEIYDDIYAESCYIPLSSGCQLSDVRNLPSDVNPIIVSSNVLEYFPYGEVREINLRGFSSSKNSEETEAPWSGKVKVQTVGVIKENAPILGMSHSASGYNAMTLSYIVEFIRDNREIVIMKTPEKYKNEIMRFGMVPNNARLVQVESGEDLSTIAKQLLKLGGIVGVTPIKPLISKMEENYKMDITSYLADFIIYTIMSLLSVGGFFALSQRLQRERLSIYYLNGASWNVCMALDIIKNIITVAIPGIIAISIEKLRLYVSYGSPGGIVVEDFLTNVLKMDVSKARDLIFKFGIRQGTNNLVIDSGSYMDEYSFLYAFLLIAGIYLLSSVLFHISIMRTKPAEEIRNWQ